MGWNYLSIPKLQRLHRWSLGMDKWFHSTLYNGCNYLSMLGLKLNHVSKRGPWWLCVKSPKKVLTWQMSYGVRHSCRQRPVHGLAHRPQGQGILSILSDINSWLHCHVVCEICEVMIIWIYFHHLILVREHGPSRVSPNQRSRWKHASHY